MPSSVRENDDFVRGFVINNNIRSILDVGAGSGTYSIMLADLVPILHAVEVWTPYITEYRLTDKYHMVHNKDIRDMTTLDLGRYDMVVFGDVMEHMTHDEAQYAWLLASKVANFGLISVPVIHYPQGAEFGNPYEEHVQEHMHPEDIRRDFGPFEAEAVYSITGTFIKRF